MKHMLIILSALLLNQALLLHVQAEETFVPSPLNATAMLFTRNCAVWVRTDPKYHDRTILRRRRYQYFIQVPIGGPATMVHTEIFRGAPRAVLGASANGSLLFADGSIVLGKVDGDKLRDGLRTPLFQLAENSLVEIPFPSLREVFSALSVADPAELTLRVRHPKKPGLTARLRVTFTRASSSALFPDLVREGVLPPAPADIRCLWPVARSDLSSILYWNGSSWTNTVFRWSAANKGANQGIQPTK